jgi:hypothetical protein
MWFCRFQANSLTLSKSFLCIRWIDSILSETYHSLFLTLTKSIHSSLNRFTPLNHLTICWIVSHKVSDLCWIDLLKFESHQSSSWALVNRFKLCLIRINLHSMFFFFCLVWIDSCFYWIDSNLYFWTKNHTCLHSLYILTLS